MASSPIASSRIKLGVSSDGLTVTATITPGPPAGADELRDALARANVVFMTDPTEVAALASALADPSYSVVDRPIAFGRPAVPGKDGYFEPAFHVGIQPGHVDEEGKMDFFDRELLKSFGLDDYVGRIHAPIAGQVGRKVDGSEIKVAAVRPSKLRVGANLRVAGDGRVYAAAPGIVLYAPEQTLELVQQHVHTGDVDLRSGNLDMQGALVVRGTIQRQFHARATGDIEVHGAVESGSVYAGGSIRIRGGVRGGASGMVCAERDISVRHAEGAHLLSGGVLALETVINSELAANEIRVTRVLRGGSAQAESSVTVQEAGVAHGKGTLLAAGIPLPRPVLDVRRAIEAGKESRMLQHRAGARGDGVRGKGGKAGREMLELEREEFARKTALAERRKQLLSTAHVHVVGVGHPGVTVQIGGCSIVLNEAVRNMRFSYDAQTRNLRAEGATR